MGTALASWLAADGEPPEILVSRRLARARRLQRRCGAGAAWTLPQFEARMPGLPPSWLWLAVSDDALEALANRWARLRRDWSGWCVAHTSGARSSAVLSPLRRRGAAVASVHPMMTFPAGEVPSPVGVVFSLEGDEAAVRRALIGVRRWQGRPLRLSAAGKSAFHLAAMFAGPGLVVGLAAAEDVMRRAGLQPKELRTARTGLLGLLQATAHNLGTLSGTREAWTGPIDGRGAWR